MQPTHTRQNRAEPEEGVSSTEFTDIVTFDLDGRREIRKLASEAPAYMYVRNVEDPEPDDRITI